MKHDSQAQFARMFRQHHDAVRAYIYRRAWPDAVDDVLSETFVTAWRRQDRIPRDALPWLLVTARNCLANHRRAAMRRDALIARLETQPSAARADPAVRFGQRQALLEALGQLSETDLELVLLSEWDGLGPGRAGQLLGLNPARARTRLLRARRTLRAALTSDIHLHDERPRPAGSPARETA